MSKDSSEPMNIVFVFIVGTSWVCVEDFFTLWSRLVSWWCPPPPPVIAVICSTNTQHSLSGSPQSCPYSAVYSSDFQNFTSLINRFYIPCETPPSSFYSAMYFKTNTNSGCVDHNNTINTFIIVCRKPLHQAIQNTVL